MNITTGTNPLTFTDFVQAIAAKMQERYAGCDVKTTTVDKNNGIHLTGVAVLEKGTDTSSSPAIYLDKLYEDYMDGTPVDEILEEAVDFYEGHKLEENPSLPDLRCFEAVKDIVCYRLVNATRNEARLQGLPHRPFLDLAITYCIPVAVADDARGAITVTDAFMEQWQVDEETLYACASANTERLYPAEVTAVEEVLREGCPDADLPDIRSGMSVLRNRIAGGGAGTMLYSGTLRRFAEQHGDFYILPSSVCEVLLLPPSPAAAPLDPQSLSGLVRTVNGSSVLPEEVLSDNAYLYHADSGEIEVIS